MPQNINSNHICNIYNVIIKLQNILKLYPKVYRNYVLYTISEASFHVTTEALLKAYCVGVL